MGASQFLHSIVFLMLGLVSCDQKRQTISTVMNAKWSDTPFVMEAAEFLAEESEDAFWSFMDYLGDDEWTSQKFHLTDKETYDLLLSFSSRYLSWSQMNLLKFSLSLRSYSPRVQMFQQIASDYGVDKLPCEAVIQHVNSGRLVCDAMLSLEDLDSDSEDKGSLFKLDHRYPHRDDYAPSVILYAQPGTRSFAKSHESLKTLASEGKLQYVLRPFVKVPPPTSSPVRLSGYGVELQIKSTEYKAQDDRKVEEEGRASDDVAGTNTSKEVAGFLFDKLRERYPEKSDKLDEFEEHLIEQSYEMAPLKAWQLQDLSLQAAARIMSNSPGESQLEMLEELAQNFPSHARALSSTSVPKDLKKEVQKNGEIFAASMNVGPKETLLSINGLHFDMDYLDVFALLDVLKSESKTLEGLDNLGFTDEQISSVSSMQLTSSNNKQPFGLDIRSTAVHWINDIEKDKEYEDWPGSVQELLRPTFPGMLRRIRKNFFHLVLIVDPADKSSLESLTTAKSFAMHRAPTKIGLLFSLNPEAGWKTDPGVMMASAFSFIAKKENSRQALNFLSKVHEECGKEEITVDKVEEVFSSTHGTAEQLSDYSTSTELESKLDGVRDFVVKSGFRTFPQILLNGVPQEMNGDEDLEEKVLTFIMKETNSLQRAVYNDHLTDRQDVLDYLMDQDHILPRLNSRILDANAGSCIKFGSVSSTDLDLDAFAVLSNPSKASTVADHLSYLTMKEEPKLNVLSCWVVANLETKEGRTLIKSAIDHVKSSPNMRIGVVHNANSPGFVSRLVQAALETQTNTVARNLIGKVVKKEATAKALESGQKSVTDYDIPGADMKALQSRMSELQVDARLFKVHSELASSLPGFSGIDQRGLVLNGKVFGPLADGEEFGSDDFGLLDKHGMAAFGEALVQKFYSVFKVATNDNPRQLSDRAMKVSALLSDRSPESSKTRIPFVFASAKHSVVRLDPVVAGKPSFDVAAITDPSTQGAQKLSTILKTLHKVVNAKIRVFFNCVDKHSEMPQKSFFRMVLEPELAFTSGGQLSFGGYHARFVDLPKSPVYTMLHHVPENWLTGPVNSLHDLDNIKLEAIDGNVFAEFELEHLLVEGHCFEVDSGNPPRGLQLTLGAKSSPLAVDTIVMANLGYFQLKSNPGRWLLNLREGKSSDIYDIASHDNTEESTETKDVQILISSFKSAIVKLKVSKKSNEDLLEGGDQADDDFGLWDKITSTFGSSGREKVAANNAAAEDDVINIFCLASGHLYERLLRIMMLSVIKNTDAKVKFWILKNYLSPSLKDFVPEYSKRYGFEYEYVQYKWPRWLNQQTEKQRIIWGYKILFLDVMFPLDVKKIIFVDTDQIVRADLRELRDMDLNGAPYGYTPFCDSNKEMEGFRFWKQGYWKSHLAGRKYHISALYVVDLVKFRQIAAGDRLRGQYQALSQDPNSLSNLDQDLPNNMIHQVPIFSLPQEWLYCETWCSTDTLKYAKSIDLCNNPLTKEPKLNAARRIVSEWTEYDEEMQELDKTIKENGGISKTIHSVVVDEAKHTEL